MATAAEDGDRSKRRGGEKDFVSSLSSKPSQHEIENVFANILTKNKRKQKERERKLSSAPTSSEASTPDKSLISLRKRLSFEEEDEEENEEHGTKIQILPAGEKRMRDHQENKKKDQVEKGSKKQRDSKMQKSGFFLDSLLESYVDQEDAESSTASNKLAPTPVKKKKEKKNAKRPLDDDDDDDASSFLDSVSRSMCVFCRCQLACCSASPHLH